MMARPRKFDYDEARRLESEGWTRKRIADRFGVTIWSIKRAIYYEARSETERRASRRFNSSGRCEDCGAACTPMALREAQRRYRGAGPLRVVCKACAFRRDTEQRQAARLDAAGRVLCGRCGEHHDRSEFRTDRRGYPVERCRSCETAARRKYRRAHPDMEAAAVRRKRARRAARLQPASGGE